jgi:hypothetical protein
MIALLIDSSTQCFYAGVLVTIVMAVLAGLYTCGAIRTEEEK